MTREPFDPFTSLRDDGTPVAPERGFAARLRARLERALTDPEDPMTLAPDPTAATAAGPIRDGDVVHAAIWVPDAPRAARFYAAVLGWTFDPSQPSDMLVLGRSISLGIWPYDGAPTLSCAYAVSDLDATLRRVAGAGGTAGTAQIRRYGRTARCADPAGHSFALHQVQPDTPRPPVNGARPGDLAYVTMHVSDSAAARAFYGEVLGWEFTPGRIEDGWGVVDAAPMTGLSGGHDSDVVVPMWRVTDVDAAVERVRAAGGTATDPQDQPYGRTAECIDDQGAPFYLGQL